MDGINRPQRKGSEPSEYEKTPQQRGNSKAAQKVDRAGRNIQRAGSAVQHTLYILLT